MKNAFTLLFLALAAVAISFTAKPNKLEGRWESKQQTPDGPFILLAIFHANNTYDGFINGKAFVTGGYTVTNDTMKISDALCNANYQGTYKLKFFTPDSVQFIALSDTCKARHDGTNMVIMKRLTAKTK